jgi:hypothetical protein
MKTRHLDHIDLRVKDLARATKFYAKLLPALGFTCDRSDSDWGTFYAIGRDKPSEFFGFTEDRQHQPNGTRIALWADIKLQRSYAKLAVKIWKDRKYVPVTAPDITRSSLRIPMETNLKSAAANSQSLRSEQLQPSVPQ